MAISFACWNCGKNFCVDDTYSGRSMTCPACKAALTVPGKALESVSWAASTQPARQAKGLSRAQKTRLLIGVGIAINVVLFGGAGLVFWRFAASQPKTYALHKLEVTAICVSPDGTKVLSGSEGVDDQTLCYWEIGTGREIRRLGLEMEPPKQFWIAPGGHAFAESFSSTLYRLDLDTGKATRLLHPVTWSQGRHLWLISKDKSEFHDLLDDAEPRSFKRDDPKNVRLVLTNCLLPDGQRLLVAHAPDRTAERKLGAGGKVISESMQTLRPGDLALKEMQTGRQVWKIVCAPECIDVVVSPDGRVAAARFASATATESPLDNSYLRNIVFKTQKASAEISLYDVEKGERTATWRGPGSGIRRIIFTPDGKKIVSGDEKGQCLVWEVATGKSNVLGSIDSPVVSQAVTPDGRRAIVGGEDGRVTVFRVP